MKRTNRMSLGTYTSMVGGKVYKIWDVTDRETFEGWYEVEMIYGGSGIIFKANTLDECKAFLESLYIQSK